MARREVLFRLQLLAALAALLAAAPPLIAAPQGATKAAPKVDPAAIRRACEACARLSVRADEDVRETVAPLATVAVRCDARLLEGVVRLGDALEREARADRVAQPALREQVRERRERWLDRTVKFFACTHVSNTLGTINPVAELCAEARKRGIVTLVDNTFATPVFQQPLQQGADIVLHSTTKYIGGHSDVVGGALLTNDEELDTAFAFLQNGAGAVPSANLTALLPFRSRP